MKSAAQAALKHRGLRSTPLSGIGGHFPSIGAVTGGSRKAAKTGPWAAGKGQTARSKTGGRKPGGHAKQNQVGSHKARPGKAGEGYCKTGQSGAIGQYQGKQLVRQPGKASKTCKAGRIILKSKLG